MTNLPLRELERLLTSAEETERALMGEVGLNNAIQTEETTSLFQFEPVTLALKRDVQIENNSGSVAFNPAFASADVIGVETDGATATSRAAIETAQLADYRSGHRMEAGIRVRVVGGSPGAGFAEWGLGVDGASNEIKFRQTADGTVSAVIEREGVDTVVPEGEWSNTSLRDFDNANGDVDFKVAGFDPFDDVGEVSTLGSSLDTDEGYIYKIDYVWYGQGLIVFSAVVTKETDAGVRQEKRPLVALVPTKKTSVTRINLPVMARADNDGTAGNTQLAVAGRQALYSGDRAGNFSTQRHVITSPPSISDTSYTTVLLSRRKVGFEQSPLEVERVGVVGGGTYDVGIRGRVTTAGTPSWDDPNRVSEDPSPVEVSEAGSVDTVASGLSGYTSGGSPPIVDAGGSGARNVRAASIESVTTSHVRQEPAGIVLREVVATSPTTPDAIVVKFESGV